MLTWTGRRMPGPVPAFAAVGCTVGAHARRLQAQSYLFEFETVDEAQRHTDGVEAQQLAPFVGDEVERVHHFDLPSCESRRTQ